MGKLIISGDGSGNKSIIITWIVMVLVAVLFFVIMVLLANNLGYLQYSRLFGWVRVSERTAFWYVFIAGGIIFFVYSVIQCALIHSRISSTWVSVHENGVIGKGINKEFPMSFALHSSYSSLSMIEFQLPLDEVSSVDLHDNNFVIINTTAGAQHKCYCENAETIRDAITNQKSGRGYVQSIPLPLSNPALTCSNCGGVLEQGDVFCEDCGQKTLSSVVLPVAVPQPVITPLHSPSPTINQARMPLLFLLDTSTSTQSYVKQLNDTLNRFKSEVCQDKQAQDILDVAVMQFSESPAVLQNFSPVGDMRAVRLVSGGNTLYSPSIREALQIIEKYTLSLTNAYKPWIIFVTGSTPSDNIDVITKEVQNVQGNDKLRFMALGVQGSDPAVLKKLTDVVFRLDGTDFTSFFEWISKCISAIAQTAPGEKPQLPTLQGNVYRDK